MTNKSFNHEGYMSPSDKQKVREIKEMEAANFNPLHMTMVGYLGAHTYNKEDLRNYYYTYPQAFKNVREGDNSGRQNETHLESA